jgi:choline dehydrogenase-like flavoprotein
MYLQYACTRSRCRCTRRCSGGTSRLSVPSGCSTAPASAPATSSRPAVSFAPVTEFEWPNIQYHFLPVAINYNGSNGVKEHGFQAHVGSMRSPSRGRVQLKSKNPRAPEHPVQLHVHRAGLAGIPRRHPLDPRDHAAAGAGRIPWPRNQPGRTAAPMSSWTFVREHAETAFHPSCSCKMGTDEMAWWMAKAACTACRACAWSMLRSCRSSPPATSTRRRS